MVVTQYMVLFNNIIHRLRFSKFATLATNDLDKEVSHFVLYVVFTVLLVVVLLCGIFLGKYSWDIEFM